MRHTATTAAAVLLLALTATACSGSDDAKDDDGKATSASPTATNTANRDGTYILTSQTIPFTDHRPTTEELLAYPPKWCAALDDGHSVEWMFSTSGGSLYPIGNDWGTVEADANKLLVAGVQAYCPKHLNTVTEELKAAGKY